ncbi:MAG: glycosyltransferase [Acutalibacteraceae bacterium]
MKISVVIPVYNEEKHIVQCIDALLNNTRKPDEILLADGGSTDRTRMLASAFSQVTILDNPEKTAAAGRNVGIRHAKGDIIAFTDGDCIVEKDWLEEIEKAFAEYEIDGLGGKVTTAPFENEYEEYWGTLAWKLIMSFGDEAYQVKEKTLNDAFVTANCAYTKALLDDLNGFDLWFANNAEDVDLCWRALEKNAKLMYIPSVVIKAHSVTTLEGIKQKSFRNGVSSSKLQKRYGKWFNYDKNIYKMWAENFCGLFSKKPNARLNLTELSWHLMGKYYGSIKAHVINI